MATLNNQIVSSSCQDSGTVTVSDFLIEPRIGDQTWQFNPTDDFPRAIPFI